MNIAGTKKYTKTAVPAVRRMITGILTAVFVTIGAALMLAFAVTAEKLQIQSIAVLSKLIWLVAPAIGCIIGVARTETKKIFKAGSIALGYIVILVIISAIMFDVDMQSILWGILCSVLGSSIGSVIKTTNTKRGKHRW